MVNFGLNSASILGIFLAVAGASLYFLRSVRPELSRDHDIFFAAVGLLCGFILLFQGWRLDPILQFGQFLLSGSAIFFAVESIRLRKVATEQARRNTPTVDRDRPVSRTRVYREPEENIDRIRDGNRYNNPYDNAVPNYDKPRLRGYEDRSDANYNSRNNYSGNRDPRNSYDRKDLRDSRRPIRDREPIQDLGDRWSKSDRQPYPNPNYDRPSSRDDFRNNEPRDYNPPTRSTPSDYERNYENNEDNYDPNYYKDLGRSYDDSEESNDDYVDYQPLERPVNYDDSRNPEDIDNPSGSEYGDRY